MIHVRHIDSTWLTEIEQLRLAQELEDRSRLVHVVAGDGAERHHERVAPGRILAVLDQVLHPRA
jgi:hypothetical protein